MAAAGHHRGDGVEEADEVRELDGVLEERDCPACGSEQWFEVPDCGNGHGDDCPERACTACGCGLVVGLPAPAAGAARRGHLAVVA